MELVGCLPSQKSHKNHFFPSLRKAVKNSLLPWFSLLCVPYLRISSPSQTKASWIVVLGASGDGCFGLYNTVVRRENLFHKVWRDFGRLILTIMFHLL